MAANTGKRGTTAGLTAEELGFDPSEVPIDEAIERVVKELGSDKDVAINLYCILPNQKGEEFLESYAVPEFEGEISFLRRLRDEFGPGEYRIQLRDGRHFRVNRRVKIGATARGERSAATGGDMSGIAQLIAAGQQRLEQLLAPLIQNSLTRVQETEETWLRRLALYREAFPAPAQESGKSGDIMSMVSQLFATFQKGLEMGRDLEPSRGAQTEDVILEAIKTLGPELVKQTRRVAAVEDQRALGKVVAPAPPIAHALRPEQQKQLNQLRQLCALLVGAAMQQSDVNLYAEMVFDQAGYDSLNELFSQGDPVELLAAADPRVLQFRPWFDQLRDTLRTIMEQERGPNVDEHGTNAGGAGGDTVDAANDARHDAPGAQEFDGPE